MAKKKSKKKKKATTRAAVPPENDVSAVTEGQVLGESAEAAPASAAEEVVIGALPPAPEAEPEQPKPAPAPIKPVEKAPPRERYEPFMGGKVRKGYKPAPRGPSSRMAARHKIAQRPRGAPPARDCVAEYETPAGYVFKLRNNKKIVIKKT